MLVDDRPVILGPVPTGSTSREDHPERGITVSEVSEAMTDIEREEAPDPKRAGYWLVRGRTAAGRRLFVAWVEYGDGRYPVHAHVIGRRGR
jgi:hypothetical protein